MVPRHFVVALLVTIALTGTMTSLLIRKFRKESRTDMERAYFEGQKDVLQGDVRIKGIVHPNNDTTWVWIKSPWNNNAKPTYIP